MKNYRNVSQSFWTDSKVDDDFTPEEKYFMLYLLTNPHTSVCGCYEISMKQMERETGYTADTIGRLISRMQDIHKVIMYDPETKEILLVNWHKYNWTKSEKLLLAIKGAAEHIKSDKLKKYVVDTVCIRYGYGIDTSDNDKDNDKDNDNEKESEESEDKPRKRTRFIPPTVEEVSAYCKERKNSVDAQQFVDFYASKGWKVGNAPMKDWRAAIRSTWERQERQQRAAPPAKSSTGTSSIDMSVVAQLMNPYGTAGGSA